MKVITEVIDECNGETETVQSTTSQRHTHCHAHTPTPSSKTNFQKSLENQCLSVIVSGDQWAFIVSAHKQRYIMLQSIFYITVKLSSVYVSDWADETMCKYLMWDLYSWTRTPVLGTIIKAWLKPLGHQAKGPSMKPNQRMFSFSFKFLRHGINQF